MSTLIVNAEEVSGGALVVHVAGDAGVVNAELLDRELSRLVTRHPKLAVVDLGGVLFISSLGMGALVSFHRAVARHGGVVRLAAVPPLVADSLRRAQLDTVIRVFPTVDDAIGTAVPSPARS